MNFYKFSYFLIGILLIYSPSVKSLDVGSIIVALDEFEEKTPKKTAAAASFHDKEKVKLNHQIFLFSLPFECKFHKYFNFYLIYFSI